MLVVLLLTSLAAVLLVLAAGSRSAAPLSRIRLFAAMAVVLPLVMIDLIGEKRRLSHYDERE